MPFHVQIPIYSTTSLVIPSLFTVSHSSQSALRGIPAEYSWPALNLYTLLG